MEGRHVFLPTNRDPPVRRLDVMTAGAIVDEIRAQAEGLNADTESGDPVVPRGAGSFLRQERLDGGRDEGHPDVRVALSGLSRGVRGHA